MPHSLSPDELAREVERQAAAAASAAGVREWDVGTSVKDHALGRYAHVAIRCGREAMTYSAHADNLAASPGYLARKFRDWFLSIKGAPADGQSQAQDQAAADAQRGGQGQAQG